MKKRIASIFLAVVLAASMVAVSAISASAVLEPTGEYTPGEGIETYRYYFYMPQDWYYSGYTDTAGLYWWDGTDSCGSVEGNGGTLAWPGYKARESEELDSLFYVDVPQDVPTVVWNNYVNGGTDKELPIYTIATQANDAKVEFYSDGDSDTYPTEFFDYLLESFEGDKALLGEYADNFFWDEEFDCGLSFKMNNMIFVIDPSQTSETFEGKPTYVGDWFFYYGNGEYGNYPIKEDAQAMGIYGDLKVAPATPDEAPTTAPTTPGNKETVPAPGQDATSAVGGTSTSDTVKGDNTAIQTGAVSLAVVLLVILSAVSGVAVFTRKKFD